MNSKLFLAILYLNRLLVEDDCNVSPEEKGKINSVFSRFMSLREGTKKYNAVREEIYNMLAEIREEKRKREEIEDEWND